MKLSVPFIPDPGYADFLAGRKSALACLYFPLPADTVMDARVRPPGVGGKNKPETDKLTTLLRPLKDVDKYILANTRFVHPSLYSHPRQIIDFLDGITALDESVGIRGIVLTDAYLINALDRTGHDLIPELEVIPGINSMIDCEDKFLAWLDLIHGTRFKTPHRLIPDRSLNRDLDRLEALTRVVRQTLPGCRIELLANEGCIHQCPFKPAHDAHIAFSNTGLVREATWSLNHNLGCHSYLFSRPHTFLKSPFIRPEDVHRYKEIADGIKLGGRTLGPTFLKRVITAYSARSFQGNLFDLMDAASFMADHFHLENTALGPEFFKSLTTCTNQCKPCRICDALFTKAARKKAGQFNQYKDIS